MYVYIEREMYTNLYIYIYIYMCASSARSDKLHIGRFSGIVDVHFHGHITSCQWHGPRLGAGLRESKEWSRGARPWTWDLPMLWASSHENQCTRWQSHTACCQILQPFEATTQDSAQVRGTKSKPRVVHLDLKRLLRDCLGGIGGIKARAEVLNEGDDGE